MATREAAARVPPRNRLPESPMKSRAGLRFQYRNPARLPTTATRNTTMNGPSVSGKQPCEKCRRDQRDATREPIHVVEKIQRVHHAAEPDDGEQRDWPRKAATERTRDEEHGKRAHDKRGHEFRERRQLQTVIDHAEDEHGCGCPRHRQFERTIGRPVCQQNGRGSRGQRGHGKSHTSHARCGDGVPPVFTRRCNQDGTPQSNSPDDGAEGKRQDRCEESQGEIGAQRPGNCTDLRRCRSRERGSWR